MKETRAETDWPAKADPYNAPEAIVMEGVKGALEWAATLDKLTETGASPFYFGEIHKEIYK